MKSCLNPHLPNRVTSLVHHHQQRARENKQRNGNLLHVGEWVSKSRHADLFSKKIAFFISWNLACERVLLNLRLMPDMTGANVRLQELFSHNCQSVATSATKGNNFKTSSHSDDSAPLLCRETNPTAGLSSSPSKAESGNAAQRQATARQPQPALPVYHHHTAIAASSSNNSVFAPIAVHHAGKHHYINQHFTRLLNPSLNPTQRPADLQLTAVIPLTPK